MAGKNHRTPRFSSNRRRFLKAVGAVGLTGVAAGCTGGGDGADTDTPAAGTTVGPSTPALDELGPEEWRERKAELAQEELEGADKILFATGMEEESVLDAFFGELTKIYPFMNRDNFLLDHSGPTTIRQRYSREAAAGQPTFDLTDAPVNRFALQGVPFADLTHLPSYQEAPDAVKFRGVVGASGYEARTISYNSDLVDNPPETFEDLFRDEFADGNIVADYTPAVLPAGASMMKYGRDNVARLFEEQQPRQIRSGRQVGTDVALGNAQLAWLAVASYAPEYQSQGEPYNNVGGTELWLWRPNALAKGISAPHPHATDLLIDAMMNPDNPGLQATEPGRLAMDEETIQPAGWSEHFTGEIWTWDKLDWPPDEVYGVYQETTDAPNL